MPTSKRRLNVTLSPNADLALTRLARRDQMPQAAKAADLIELALEIEEDQIWDAIANERDTKKSPLVTHRRAWA